MYLFVAFTVLSCLWQALPYLQSLLASSLWTTFNLPQSTTVGSVRLEDSLVVELRVGGDTQSAHFTRRLLQQSLLAHVVVVVILSAAMFTAPPPTKRVAAGLVGLGILLFDIGCIWAMKRFPRAVSWAVRFSFLAWPLCLFGLDRPPLSSLDGVLPIDASTPLVALLGWSLLSAVLEVVEKVFSPPSHSQMSSVPSVMLILWMLAAALCAACEIAYHHDQMRWTSGLYLCCAVIPMYLVWFAFDSLGAKFRRLVTAFERTLQEKSELSDALCKLQADNGILKEKAGHVGTLAHEIRTPLNALLSCCTLLGDTALSPEQADYVKMMVTCGSQITNNIDHVLEVSRLEERKVVLQSRPFCLKSVCEDSLDIVRHLAQRKGLDLVLQSINPSSTLVKGDANRLKQALLNLLSNSIKFTKTGCVTLSVCAIPYATSGPDAVSMASIRLEVSDTGIGLTAEQQAKLFQPFVQASDGTYGKYGGSGLGLVITRQLIHLMGGTIDIDANRTMPGVGSTFVIFLDLPLADISSMESETGIPTTTTGCPTTNSSPSLDSPHCRPVGSMPSTCAATITGGPSSFWRPASCISDINNNANHPRCSTSSHKSHHSEGSDPQSPSPIVSPSGSTLKNMTPFRHPPFALAAMPVAYVSSTIEPTRPSNDRSVGPGCASPQSREVPTITSSQFTTTSASTLLPPSFSTRSGTLAGLLGRRRQSSMLSQRDGEISGNGFDDVRLGERPHFAPSAISMNDVLPSTTSSEHPSARWTDQFAAFSVLLVDDNTMSNLLMVRLLKSIGFVNVDAVHDGVEALELLKTRTSMHLIITDLELPSIDGFALATSVRVRFQEKLSPISSHPPNVGGPAPFVRGAPSDPRWPVIFALSGTDRADITERCAEAGIDAFLPKPVSRARLVKMVTRWLIERDTAMPTRGERLYSSPSLLNTMPVLPTSLSV